MTSGNVRKLYVNIHVYMTSRRKDTMIKILKLLARNSRKNGLEDGDLAERLFTNLKKRYNKARSTSNCGTGSSRKTAINKAKKLDELSYLSWLTPFIQLRGEANKF